MESNIQTHRESIRNKRNVESKNNRQKKHRFNFRRKRNFIINPPFIHREFNIFLPRSRQFILSHGPSSGREFTISLINKASFQRRANEIFNHIDFNRFGIHSQSKHFIPGFKTGEFGVRLERLFIDHRLRDRQKVPNKQQKGHQRNSGLLGSGSSLQRESRV